VHVIFGVFNFGAFILGGFVYICMTRAMQSNTNHILTLQIEQYYFTCNRSFLWDNPFLPSTVPSSDLTYLPFKNCFQAKNSKSVHSPLTAQVSVTALEMLYYFVRNKTWKFLFIIFCLSTEAPKLIMKDEFSCVYNISRLGLSKDHITFRGRQGQF
jgi:hypothetical protein